MSTNLGFGKPQPKTTKQPSKRAKAAKQYEQMQADGTPEFEIYVRIQNKKNWYPVGVIAVKRSNQINQAIFGSQADLLQGAFRLYPILRKHQHQLEYGYRLKEFKDEPIQLATVPTSNGQGFLSGLLSLMDSLKNRMTAFLQQR